MQKQIKIEDNRSCQPIGLKNKNGEVLVMVMGESVTINGRNISLTKPNIVSLYINKSLKEYSQSKILKLQIDSIELNSSKKKVTPLLYDYFECTMSSITNMYCAVETFVNLCIPNDFVYRRKNTKKIIEEYNKALIERWCTLDEKLNRIIPKVFGIKSPNQMQFWNNFLLLEKFRNDIIHPKTSNYELRLEPGDPYVREDNKFLQMLCEDNLDDIINSGIDLIKYVVESTPPNEEYPIFNNTFIIKIKEVNDFGDELILVKKRNGL